MFYLQTDRNLYKNHSNMAMTDLFAPKQTSKQTNKQNNKQTHIADYTFISVVTRNKELWLIQFLYRPVSQLPRLKFNLRK